MGCMQNKETKKVDSDQIIAPQQNLSNLKGQFQILQRQKDREHFKVERMSRSTNVQDVLPELPVSPAPTLNEQPVKGLLQKLSEGSFFSNLTKNQLDSVARLFVPGQLAAGDYLFQKGKETISLIYIESGKIKLQTSSAVLGSGQLFNQEQFICRSKRSESAVAVEKCRLWLLHIDLLLEIKKTIDQRLVPLIRSVINFTTTLNLLSDKQKQQLSKVAVMAQYSTGKFLIREGDEARCFGLVVSGQLAVKIQGKLVNYLKEGYTFGESILLDGKSRHTATVRAVRKTKVLLLSKSDMLAILGADVDRLFRYNSAMWALNKTNKLSLLSYFQKDKLINEIAYRQVRAGEKILEVGKESNQFIFAFSTGLVRNSGNLVCERGSFFGENAVFESKTVNAESVVAENDGVIGTLHFKVLNKIVGRLQISLTEARARERLRRQWRDRELKDCVVTQKLSQGLLSLNFLVAKGRSKESAVLRCFSRKLRRKNMLRKQVLTQAIRVRQLPLKLFPPLLSSFSDNDFHFFVEENDSCVLLEKLISDSRKFNFDQRRFLIATILLGLEELHAHEILARKLDSSQIVLGENGYPRLQNTEYCKLVKSSSEHRTSTVVGAPDSHPPEVVLGQPYSFAADFWLVGLTFYQILQRKRLFSQLKDPAEIYRRITSFKPTFDSFETHRVEGQLLRDLLVLDPATRLSLGRRYRRHKLFADLQGWRQLHESQIVSPLLGELKGMKSEPLPLKKSLTQTLQEFRLSECQLKSMFSKRFSLDNNF